MTLGVVFVAGRNLVPRPATGMTAFVTAAVWAMLETLTSPLEVSVHGMAESDHGSSRATMAAGDADHASLSLNERKSLLRKELLLARAALTDADRSAAGRALRDAGLDLPEVGMAGAIAAYLGVGTEPETSALVYALWERGSYVLLPVLLPDNDLDWASYEGPDSLERGPHGLAQPTEPLRGVAGVGRADVVIVPALAVDRGGIRLGRGRGALYPAPARGGPPAPARPLR